MRRTLILIAALGLAACGETREEAQARSAREGLERERAQFDEKAGQDLLSLGGVGDSAPSPADRVAPEAADGDDGPAVDSAPCSDITDAEAFVRCLYAGTASGSIRTGQEPDGPAYLSERYWRTIQQMRAAGPGWASMDPLCLCNAPGETSLSRARIGAPIDDGAAVEIMIEQNGQMGNLRVELQRTDDGWRVNDVVAHSG